MKNCPCLLCGALSSQLTNSIQLVLPSDLLREPALACGLVSIAGSSVRIREIREALDRLFEPLRSLELLDCFLRALGSQQRNADVATRAGALGFELECLGV